jgi:hypothetical protein
LTIFPTPGNSTVCPGQILTYEVKASTGSLPSCTYNWSLPNSKGTFHLDQNKGKIVSVIWNDTPEIGELKVQASNCSNPNNDNLSRKENYTIRSLKNKTPQNPMVISPLPYCSTNPVTLKVDEMIIPNTGLGTNIPAGYPDEYVWPLQVGMERRLRPHRPGYIWFQPKKPKMLQDYQRLGI